MRRLCRMPSQAVGTLKHDQSYDDKLSSVVLGTLCNMSFDGLCIMVGSPSRLEIM